MTEKWIITRPVGDLSRGLTVEARRGQDPHLAIVRDDGGIVHLDLNEVADLVDVLSQAAAELAAEAGGQAAQAIQHELADQYREAIGSIPRGQLWQPCERADCDNEPVCMNCLLCQEKHCHCFNE